MKKKLLLAGAAIAIGATFLLTSCGATNVYVDQKEAHLFTKYEQITELTGFSNVDANQKFVYFTKNDAEITTHKLYDVEQNKVVLTVTDTATLAYDVEGDTNFYAVSSTDTSVAATPKYGVELYQADGKKVVSETSQTDTDVAVNAVDYDSDGVTDYVAIGSKFYKIQDNGKIEYKYDMKDKTLDAAFTGMPTAYAGGYFHFTSSGTVYTFDDTMTLVNTYTVQSGSSIDHICTLFLSSGKILVQQIETVGAVYFGNTDCDFIEDGACCNLNTYLVSPNGDVKEIDCKYILDGSESSAEELEYAGIESPDYDYVISGIVGKIKDKKIDDSKEMAVGVFKDGKVEEVKTVIKNQSIDNAPVRLANGNYIVQDVVGQYFLTDGGGKVLKQMNLAGAKCNANFIVVGDKIYTLKGEEVTLPEGYTYYERTTHLLIVKKDASLYTFDGKNVALLGDEAKVNVNVTLNGAFISVANADNTSYAYYNANGEKLGDFNHTLVVIAGNDEGDVAILRVGDGGSETVYYRVK